jgi:hypothetical protein
MLPAVGAGDHDHALIIDEVVHRVRKAEELRPPNVIQHDGKLGRFAFDQRQYRAGGPQELEP